MVPVKPDRTIGSIESGTAEVLGATVDAAGVNFAVYSDNAEQMDLCLFSADGKKEIARIPLAENTGGIWHGYLPGLRAGALYGYRAHGPYSIEEGHRFNPNKLLIDPYAKALVGDLAWHKAVYGYDRSVEDQTASISTLDSARYVPKSVVTKSKPLASSVRSAPRFNAEEFIYEAHVRGLTIQNQKIEPSLRGTYEALASDAVIQHIKSLGVTCVELMPVHAFVDDAFLVERGLSNYWGYNTLSFFALESRYFGPEGSEGFRSAVAKLKDAGISVILDVVYNHTAEADMYGPTVCFRGLDNASYYRLVANDKKTYINDSGCGNSLQCSHPMVNRLILDSLRYWVEHYGVDGFRFDLATALGRGDQGFSWSSPFIAAALQDPVLANVRLIAEPWDLGPGGYQLGGFPPPFCEWNDQFRDSVRRFWTAETHSAQALAGRLIGSADYFDKHGRRSWSSINYVCSHDGFTLQDLVSYNNRHNAGNRENNRDGHHANFSDNCGVEGPTDDVAINARRQQRIRNMLATLFISQGVPMLLAGDECGNSQQGNNNAYCQDNAISWIDWQRADMDLIKYVTVLAKLRRGNPALRQSTFLHGEPVENDGLPNVQWLGFSGDTVDWKDAELSRFVLLVRASYGPAPEQENTVLIAFNRSDEPAVCTLPAASVNSKWLVELDTSTTAQQQEIIKADVYPVKSDSIVVLSDGNIDERVD